MPAPAAAAEAAAEAVAEEAAPLMAFFAITLACALVAGAVVRYVGKRLADTEPTPPPLVQQEDEYDEDQDQDDAQPYDEQQY